MPISLWSTGSCFSVFHSFQSSAWSASRPKVGLVLSGGGAKGFAQIGVLKMIDSLQIPVDYIAGTSMGAIVGGLYAAGYSGIALEQLVQRQTISGILIATNLPGKNQRRPEKQGIPESMQIGFTTASSTCVAIKDGLYADTCKIAVIIIRLTRCNSACRRRRLE